MRREKSKSDRRIAVIWILVTILAYAVGYDEGQEDIYDKVENGVSLEELYKVEVDGE